MPLSGRGYNAQKGFENQQCTIKVGLVEIKENFPLYGRQNFEGQVLV
jgi:hypothetical protein